VFPGQISSLQRVAFIANVTCFSFFFYQASRAEKRPVLSAPSAFYESFQVCVFSHRDIMCVSAGPSYATFTLKCQLLFHFSAPHRAGIDQSDYAQQRDDCCKAICDFSLCICFRWQIRRPRAYADRDHEDRGGRRGTSPAGKGETLDPTCTRFMLIFLSCNITQQLPEKGAICEVLLSGKSFIIL